jgi:hypothetical protein
MSSPGIGVQQWANSILALPAFLMKTGFLSSRAELWCSSLKLVLLLSDVQESMIVSGAGFFRSIAS